MLRHFCLKPVSRNSTATTVSMHGIVSLLKPRRALRRGYTPPKRWSRHVEITCGLHHMRLRHLRYPPGHIHAIIRRLALSGPVDTRSARSPWTQGKNLPEPDSANRLNIDQLWWVLHCLSVLPCEKVRTKLQVNLPQKQYTIQQCQPALDDAPCKASVKRARITSHLRYTCKKDMLVSDLLWPVVKLRQ